MSNPCINRWGMNTFWHHLWYSDTNYSLNWQHDTIFEKLIHTFLFFGLHAPNNLFANVYWYSKQFSRIQVPTYQRWFINDRKTIPLITKFSKRQERVCVFLMKLWIMRYGSWLIINLYWFNPDRNTRRIRRNSYGHKDLLYINKPKGLTTIRRIKTLLSAKFFNYVTKQSYYRF
jgi:hypothetical protein